MVQIPKKINFDFSGPDSTNKTDGSASLSSSNGFAPGSDISVSDSKIAKLGAQNAKSSTEMQNLALEHRKIQDFMQPKSLIDEFNIKEGYKVVEFGSGHGSISLTLAKSHPEAEFYAVEVQKDLLLKMLKEAKEMHLSNIKAVWGDVEQKMGAKLADNFANLVFFVNSLFQIEDKKSALLEAKRILKQNAELLLVDWKKDAPVGPDVNHRIDKNDLLEMMQELGFLFTSEKDVSGTHFLLHFVKK